METYLTNDDITVLLEALGDWESRDNYAELFTGILSAVTAKDDSPESRAAWMAERDAAHAKTVKAKQEREERSIIIKAKLVLLRAKATADEIDARF